VPGSLAHVAFTEQPVGDLEHRHRVQRGDLAISPECAHGQRHRRVCPLLGAALLARRVDAPGSNVLEELLRACRRRRLGEGAADVDPGVIVAATDRGAAVCLDVNARRQVELRRPRAVAGFPDGE
jgi:hypothetical protein